MRLLRSDDVGYRNLTFDFKTDRIGFKGLGKEFYSRSETYAFVILCSLLALKENKDERVLILINEKGYYLGILYFKEDWFIKKLEEILAELES